MEGFSLSDFVFKGFEAFFSFFLSRVFYAFWISKAFLAGICFSGWPCYSRLLCYIYFIFSRVLYGKSPKVVVFCLFLRTLVIFEAWGLSQRCFKVYLGHLKPSKTLFWVPKN